MTINEIKQKIRYCFYKNLFISTIYYKKNINRIKIVFFKLTGLPEKGIIKKYHQLVNYSIDVLNQIL
jgi:hypothetical protein